MAVRTWGFKTTLLSSSVVGRDSLASRASLKIFLYSSCSWHSWMVSYSILASMKVRLAITLILWAQLLTIFFSCFSVSSSLQSPIDCLLASKTLPILSISALTSEAVHIAGWLPKWQRWNRCQNCFAINLWSRERFGKYIVNMCSLPFSCLFMEVCLQKRTYLVSLQSQKNAEQRYKLLMQHTLPGRNLLFFCP